MNNLVFITDTGEMKISGRKLHEFLEVTTRYNDWFPRMCEYGFTEGQDFYSKMSKTSESGGRPSIDHEMTISMAKEICMIQRTDKGKEARQYFLQIEKDWNSPEKIMARALKISNGMLEQAKLQIEADKPKVLFANSVQVTTNTILIRELSKMISQNGYQIGEKRLFEWMRENGYLIRKIGADYNKPTQRAMNMGLFKISETAITHSDGVKTHTTTRVTGKGQLYFINKFLGKTAA